MKKEKVYGAEMTSIQNMMFSKWIADNSIAMNTLTEDQRYELTISWLERNESKE